MKFLIDINHPAHVHFFRNPIKLLIDRGHEVMVTSRDKEMALDLLEELGIPMSSRWIGRVVHDLRETQAVL